MSTVFNLSYDDRRIRTVMGQLLRQTGDLTPANREVGEYGLFVTDEHFRNEEDPEGNPWQPLSPVTIAQKQAMGRMMQILQSTGDMRSRTTYEATPTQVTIGNNSTKAKKHQRGIGVPKREFLGFNDENLQEILAIYEEHLDL